MKIGVSRVCITPPVGIDLTGYGARVQPSIGVHDDLYARSCFLEQGQDRLLWIHADLLSLDRDTVRRLRKALSLELGLEERQIVFSATHTHSGPATQRLLGCGTRDPAYLATLDNLLLDAGRQAAARTEAVTLLFAEGLLSLSVDRRKKASAHTDPILPVLAFRGSDGGFRAVISNYAVHNVALSHKNRLISADLAGVAARTAGDRLPGNPVVFCTNGACGNLNPPRLTDDFSGPEEYGSRLGEAVADLVRTSAEVGTPALSSRLAAVAVPLTVQTPGQVEEERKRAYEKSPTPWSAAVLEEWRNNTLAWIASGKAADAIESDVQAIRIGPARFAAMGAEVFSRMADDLRERCGRHTYVIGYANGNLGYLPFREAFGEGGYEVDYAYKLYMHFNVAPAAFETMRDKAVELLKSLPDTPAWP